MPSVPGKFSWALTTVSGWCRIHLVYQADEPGFQTTPGAYDYGHESKLPSAFGAVLGQPYGGRDNVQRRRNGSSAGARKDHQQGAGHLHERYRTDNAALLPKLSPAE